MTAPGMLEQAADIIGSAAEREHAAESRGYEHGYKDGYSRCVADVREMDSEPQDISEPAPWPTKIDPALDRLRYPPHGRARFGEARDDDYAGGPPAGWGPDEHPGMVWLAGPAVHLHSCGAACRGYEPGRYAPGAAARILATLPGDHRDEIARLTALARRDGAAA